MQIDSDVHKHVSSFFVSVIHHPVAGHCCMVNPVTPSWNMMAACQLGIAINSFLPADAVGIPGKVL